METIQLQSVGRVNAKKAEDFRIGEKMAWNFGSTTKITRVIKETLKTITFEMIGETTHERRFNKSRLVAIG